MPYDAKKLAAMRGDKEPDPEDPNEAEEVKEGEPEPEEDGGPSEEEISAAKRLKSALDAGNWRAVCAAVKDLAGGE